MSDEKQLAEFIVCPATKPETRARLSALSLRDQSRAEGEGRGEKCWEHCHKL